MIRLPYTIENISLVQEFLDETRRRLSNGVEITFTKKASEELEDLVLDYDLDISDIESALENLSTNDYYRGVDPSTKADFEVCVFCTSVGKDNVKIYLKYGLEVNGLQILLFSNHIPNYPMIQPFNN